MTQPFAGRRTRNIAQDHSDPVMCHPDQWGYCPCPLEDAPAEVAELVCSDTGGVATIKPEVRWGADTGFEPLKVTTEPEHLPVFDLDFAATLVPSGTPGHFHLYLDKPVAWSKYVKVLEAMTDAGLCQPGYLNTTRERRFAAVRHPDRPKRLVA